MATPDRTPDDGRPSPEACARFAIELHRELTSSRLAWDAALLRSDAALASGDQEAVDSAIDDHRLLLAALEDRVAAVLDSATHGPRNDRAVPDAASEAGPAIRAGATTGAPAGTPPLPAWRRGVASLLGAAAVVSLVAAVAVGTLPALDGASTSPAAASRDLDVLDATDLAVAGTGAAGRFTVPEVAGPERDLPRFSGELPPSAVVGPPAEEPLATSASPAEAPASEDAGDLADGPGAPEVVEPIAAPAGGDPTTEPGGATVMPPLDELVSRLPDGDPEGAEVASSLPEPLVELSERVRRSLRSLPASDPAPGLG